MASEATTTLTAGILESFVPAGGEGGAKVKLPKLGALVMGDEELNVTEGITV